MISQDLINELVGGYTQSKFEEKYLKEKIIEILKFIIPQISALVRQRKEEKLVSLWEAVKEEESIKNLFSEAIKIIERPILIYVASKFTNNQSVGTKIVEEALLWK
jgi:arsenate reductase-like glutaredoxin family protein